MRQRNVREERMKELKRLREVDKLLLGNCPRRAIARAMRVEGKLSERGKKEMEIIKRAAAAILGRKEQEMRLDTGMEDTEEY